MPTIELTLERIEEGRLKIRDVVEERSRFEASIHNLDQEAFHERSCQFASEILAARQGMKAALLDFERMPDCHYTRLQRQLEEFHQVAPLDLSVFVMTKFPDGSDSKDRELQRVIECVEEQIRAAAFVPRRASGEQYHRWLWGNVEVFMLGSARGVAIVEDRYAPELNPNVAMEWGWMTALNRRVLFLREKRFRHGRADWEGLLHESFDWDNPEPDVRAAVTKFLRT